MNSIRDYKEVLRSLKHSEWILICLMVLPISTNTEHTHKKRFNFLGGRYPKNNFNTIKIEMVISNLRSV